MRDRRQTMKDCLPMRNASFRAMAVSVLAMLSLLPGVLVVQPARAQAPKVVIDCLPPWETNNRFLESTKIKHPGLSLNGFDCDDNCDIGYGLKQILEKVYGSDTEREVQKVFKAIVEQATQKFEDVSSVGDIRNNSGRLQAKGFVALASYVLENNDYDPTLLEPALPSAAVAVKNFKTALLESKWKFKTNKRQDGVKWATSVMNVARSIDFYLALENAYKHYNIDEFNSETSTNILSNIQKLSLMNDYSHLINYLESIRDIFKVDGTILVSRYHAEPGNASLKMQLAIGYAALVWQNNVSLNNTPWDYNNTMANYINRSFPAMLAVSSGNRNRYWGYQSDDGKYFWAEGAYYLHLAISQVIPFLHVARINNLLKEQGYTQDPFKDTRILNPLDWLADISTPDGKIPPIDDGNKSNMYNTSVLRWASDYGDKDIGEKFAWIGNTASRSDLYPVEIAIPRIEKPMESPLSDVIGNTFENRKNNENGRQEIVVRRTTNNDKQHYIFLNGESGDAISRGEGHEQADQMQLLYYVDDSSYIMDSGYDTGELDYGVVSGFVFGDYENSTWNHYYDHNVMTVHTRNSLYLDGGVRAPVVSVFKRRRVSEHQNVNRIHRENVNKVDILSSSISLDGVNELGQIWYAGEYNRDVLFINDYIFPYLIDINAIKNVDSGNNYEMIYHVNSEDTNFSLYNDRSLEYVVWNNIYKTDQKTINPEKDTNKKLHLQPFFVERSLYKYFILPDKTREPYVADLSKGAGVNIKSLQLIHNGGFLTTVSFIHAFSAGNVLPFLFKAEKPIYQNELEWQYFTRHNTDTTTVDVLIVRSINDTVDNDIHFSIPDANSFYAYLPSDKEYGFTRIVKDDNNWKMNSDFNLNLKISIPRVAISGPLCIQKNQKGHYKSSPVIGGKPPYSYSWSYYRTCPNAGSDLLSPSLGPKCNAWNGIGTTKDVDFGGHNGENFQIRLTVTDSSSPVRSASSQQLEVQVHPSSSVGCPLDPDSVPEPDGKMNKMDPRVEQLFDSNFNEVKESIPEVYALRQNFPNPFNPATEILFDLPESVWVSLVVYDVLGREVARLVEGELQAGWHRARFDAGSLPSGVYLYRIQAGNFMDTGRMLLLK